MTANTNLASSPDSSSDSSITNNQPLLDSSLNLDAENSLPTVVCIVNVNNNNYINNYEFNFQIVSENSKYVTFFLQVSDKGIEIKNQQLREAARSILKLIPPAKFAMQKIEVLKFINMILL